MRTERLAWMVAGLLFAASVVNYIDRAVLAVVMPQVRRDLGLTATDYALAVNAFLAMYMVAYILGGRVADRLGCRRTFLATIVFWSLASMAHAAVRGLGTLALFRALLGMGEAGFYPAAIRGAAEWFPPESRAKAVGLVLSALSVGTLVTPPLVALITLRSGWRAAFVATGALGLLLVPPWVALHRKIRSVYGAPDPAPALERAPRAAAEDPVTLGRVLGTRKYWRMLAARGCSDAAWYFYLFWMPGYFQEARGLTLEAVGRLLWIPYFSAGVGALAGAWAASALIQRGLGLDAGRKTVLAASAALCFAGSWAWLPAGVPPALALVSLALFAHQAWSTNIHTAITEISPAAHVSVLYGITGAAGTLMGALVQSLVGPVVDHLGYDPAFVGAGALYLLAVGLLFGAGKIERIRGPGI